MPNRLSALVVVIAALLAGQAFGQATDVLRFHGASDASAAVGVADDVLVVGDDETNVLRVYTVQGGASVAQWDASAFLQVDPEHPEADIEGAARVGERIYWITSHGRNKDGKARRSRERFFATQVRQRDGKWEFTPAGKPYADLTVALASDPALAELGLAGAIGLGKKSDSQLAPKVAGLNIEALASRDDGGVMWLGLRNPVVKGQAVLIGLTNAPAVVERGDRPVFAKPLLWDLGGRGVRDMTWVAEAGKFAILAGPAGEGGGEAVLYGWSGRREEPPVRADTKWGQDLTPEAVVAWPGVPRFLVLSDDGTRVVKVNGPAACVEGEYRADGTCLNKHLLDVGRRTFRGMWGSLSAER